MDASKASLWNSKFPLLIIAHRGFSGAAPENTLAAFQKAIEAGSDMIELDVHLSRDGEVVVIHDGTLNRTTTGKGKVSDHTLEELKQLDSGSWFGPAFAGQRIPMLQEVLDLCRNRILVNIELKAEGLGRYTVIDLSDRSLQEAEKAGMAGQVLFSSFDLAAIERIQMKKPGMPVALITALPWNSPADLAKEMCFTILNCRSKTLSRNNLSKAHQEGLQVNVWTVNDEKEMAQFVSLGVDGIITNYPDRLLRTLKRA
jgi:glycerophosphoryl diester phosphodiesterase